MSINPELLKLVEMMPEEDQAELVRKFKPMTRNVLSTNCPNEDDPVERWFEGINNQMNDDEYLPLPSDPRHPIHNQPVEKEGDEDVLELPSGNWGQ